MQTTIYFADEDRYLLDLVDKLALQERKSRSAIILTILEHYFERDSRLGEILVDMGAASAQDVQHALEAQQADPQWRPLGEILVTKRIVSTEQLERALVVQGRSRGRSSFQRA
ncbi:MAG: hypothetical protein R6U88_06880 [Candidatus Bipolaricaulota bacterium]